MQPVRAKLNRNEQSLSAHPRSRRHDRILADVARGPFTYPLPLSTISIAPAALLPRRRGKGEQDVAMLEHLGNVTARHVNREPFERPRTVVSVNPVPQPTAVASSSAANATSSLATPASRSGIRRKAVASTLRATSRPPPISPPRAIFNPIFPDCPRCESHLPARSVALAPVTAQESRFDCYATIQSRLASPSARPAAADSAPCRSFQYRPLAIDAAACLPRHISLHARLIALKRHGGFALQEAVVSLSPA